MSNSKERDWEALAEELRALIGKTIPETACEVIVKADGLEIHPGATNETGAFYQTEEIVDFCRSKTLLNWVCAAGGLLKTVAYIR